MSRVAGASAAAVSDKLGVGKLGVDAPVGSIWSVIEAESVETRQTADTTSTSLTPRERALADREFAKPFQFLNLGILAYIGASQALAQVSVDEKVVLGAGPVGFLLWRAIYWTKQVSWRNRVLIFMDWLRTGVFGRDIANIGK